MTASSPSRDSLPYDYTPDEGRVRGHRNPAGRITRAKASPAKKRRIFARDGYRCVYVTKTGKRCPATENLTIEHIIPRSEGGSNKDTNLETLCEQHNRLRAAERARWREEMKWGIPWPVLKKLNRWNPVPPKGPKESVMRGDEA